MTISRRELLAAAAASALPCCGPAIVPAACAKHPTGSCTATPPGVPTATPNPPFFTTRCELYSYNEMQHENPYLFRPQSVDELKAVMRSLKADERVTFRGGGQSLDSQSLNPSRVIAMDAPCFSFIDEPRKEDNRERYYIRTGAGARWWDVIEKVAERGLFPPSLATAADATVGGTLSADCVSRMSAVYGKEGEQIRSFNIVLPNGEERTCTREDEGANADLFNAVIGGFGCLGAVTEVTFDLVPIRSRPNEVGKVPTVLTRSTRHANNVDWDELLTRLRSKTLRERLRVWKEDQPEKRELSGAPPLWPAVSVACFMCGEGMTANLLEQRFVEARDLRPTPGDIYAREPEISVTAARLSTLWPTAVEFATDLGFPSGEFVDDLFGWAFFFGNWATRAKERAHERGVRLNFTQHTFALPALVEGRPDTRPARRFIEALESRLHHADVRPGTIDVLYVPGDRFLMSASRYLDAYLITVSLAFRKRGDYLDEVKEMLKALACDCRELGGRVHLVKSVVASPEDLRAMYGEPAAKFNELKQLHDPLNVLGNEFFERVFKA